MACVNCHSEIFITSSRQHNAVSVSSKRFTADVITLIKIISGDIEECILLKKELEIRVNAVTFCSN